MSTVDSQSVRDALRELGSVEDQRRLWLSTGSNGAEVSSFSEAVEQLYTDTGLSDALICDRTGYSQKLNERFRELKELLRTVNHGSGPTCTIDDPVMIAAGLLANEILQLMCEESAKTT
jgi:hypothetical protein